MMDVAMGETAPNANGEDEIIVYDIDTIVSLLAKPLNELREFELLEVRDFHSKHKTQAPTTGLPQPPQMLADVVAPEELKKVLDFTGEIDGGGVKMSMYDDYVTKPPMELVPQALTRGAARALGYGANKYAPNNWRRGMRWGEVFGGLQRHLTAWNEGEDFDRTDVTPPGSGLSHLDHAAACLAFLMHMVAHEAYHNMDDRP